MKRRRRRPYDPIKAAKIVMMAESNAVTSRKTKNLPAIINHDQLLRKNADPNDQMFKCMQELKNIRQATVEKVLKKVGKVMDQWTNLTMHFILIFFK